MNLKQNESGRSMVEMLGVLAVMGIISIGGVYGYTKAMERHRANGLLNEANKRSVMVASQLMAGKNTKDVNIKEFPKETPYGTFSTNITSDGNGKFKMTVSGLDKATCDLLTSFAGGPLRRVSCQKSGTSFTAELFFNKDLSTTEKASDYNGNQSACEADSSRQYCASNDTCISATDTCPPSGPTCAINPTTDCLSGALVDGECACAPVTGDNVECTSWTTNECGKGKYCVLYVYSPDTDPTSGTCQPVSHIGGYKTETVKGHEYTMSSCSNCPDWWSAQSWCKAHNKTMVSLSDLHCTSSGCTDNLWEDLGNALYKSYTWTTDMPDSYEAFYVTLYGGNVGGNRRTSGFDVLCVLGSAL